MSEVMLCLPQKSSISCVSSMPPMSEPAMALRPDDQGEDAGRRVRRGRDADQAHGAVTLEAVDERVEVVRGGDGVEDEVEAAGVRRHVVGVLAR